jgi:hypothetical protein
MTNKSKELLAWCKEKRIFSKADIIAYESRNYYLRADRTIRDFVRRGIVRKLDKDECVRRNLKGNMAWYEFIKAE